MMYGLWIIPVTLLGDVLVVTFLMAFLMSFLMAFLGDVSKVYSGACDV